MFFAVMTLDAVVIVLLLYQTLLRLRRSGSVAALASAAHRLRNVLFLLEIVPVVVVFFVATLALSLSSDPLARAAQALTLLGLWIALDLAGFLIALALLVRTRIALLAGLALVLAAVPIVLYTPLPHFLDATSAGWYVPFALLGLALTVICYTLLVRAGRLLAADAA